VQEYGARPGSTLFGEAGACDDGSVIDYVITSPLSLARLLWWYGEDDLWPRSLSLSPEAVARLSRRFAQVRRDTEGAEVWSHARADACLLLPVIELLEGAARPAARRHRRPDEAMPQVLDVELEKRWRDPVLEEVARLVDKMSGSPQRPDVPADQPRLAGRWASW
jgi:hypothetical protein